MEMTGERTITLEGEWWQDPHHPQFYLYGTRGEEPLASIKLDEPLRDGETLRVPLVVTLTEN
jgi:hypothetical protein